MSSLYAEQIVDGGDKRDFFLYRLHERSCLSLKAVYVLALTIMSASTS